MSEPIRKPDDSDGQNPIFPGDEPQAPKPGTSTEDGAETIIVPIVR